MRLFTGQFSKRLRQKGLTLVELMVSIAISGTVLAGLVSVLVATKSNFISQRELSGLQENARFAVKYLTDEIRMAGSSGCLSPTNTVNTINGGTTWYLSGVGLQGYEYDAGINTFPSDFKASVRANTDALTVQRGERTGLNITSHNGSSAQINITGTHSYKPGQIMVMSTPDCRNMAVFQMSGPTNNSNNAGNMVHNTGGSISPGNCTKNLGTTTGVTSVTCANSSSSSSLNFDAGSTLLEMHSEAYYVGNSESDSTVPALFRQRMVLNTSTSTNSTVAEELVQGVENLQIFYGVDSNNDSLADQYVKANSAVITTAGWKKVVSVRIAMRMRSITPVYNDNTAYGTFEGVTGTSGSDRYMRQSVTTTIKVRNNN